MRAGFWMLAVFATAWASAALLADNVGAAWLWLPWSLSGFLLVRALGDPATARPAEPHVRALVLRWSAIEVIGIIIAVRVLTILHRPDAIFAAVALIVGLHFLPLARGMPARVYHATAIGLVLAGAGGMLLPVAQHAVVIGWAGAVILWATMIARVAELRAYAVPYIGADNPQRSEA